MARQRRSKSNNKQASKSAATKATLTLEKIGAPTPEMMARVTFEAGQILSETGQRIGFAFRRKPLLEKLALSGAFSFDEVDAMRFYRTAFDRTERSLVKSCLNITNGGRGEGPAEILTMTPRMIDAKRKLEYCERSLGPTLHTMRGVLLHDLSFSELAMQRYGSRLTVTAASKSKPAPKSGRHREYIRQEFLSGVKLLTNAIREIILTGPTEEIWVEALADGSAVIRRGLFAPAGRYRCWAEPATIVQAIDRMRQRFGYSLLFINAEHAIKALKLEELDRLKLII